MVKLWWHRRPCSPVTMLLHKFYVISIFYNISSLFFIKVNFSFRGEYVYFKNIMYKLRTMSDPLETWNLNPNSTHSPIPYIHQFHTFTNSMHLFVYMPHFTIIHFRFNRKYWRNVSPLIHAYWYDDHMQTFNYTFVCYLSLNTIKKLSIKTIFNSCHK